VLALLVVAPLRLAVGWWWVDDGSFAFFAAQTLSQVAVVPALVTAMHVVAVQAVGRGERPSVTVSAGAALRLAVPLVLVVGLYVVLVFLGSLALIVPGLILALRFYFGAQHVVVDGARGIEALYESGRLTGDGRWLVALVVIALTWAVSFGADAATVAAIDAVESDVAAATLDVLSLSLVVSFTALVGTLLFFDLRARAA
jgi:hypothetical protein